MCHNPVCPVYIALLNKTTVRVISLLIRFLFQILHFIAIRCKFQT